MKGARTDYELFQEYGALIGQRAIFFGSEDETDVEECGVDWRSSKKLIKNLLYLDSINHKTITLHFSSPGGDWERGMAIYDAIKMIKSPVKFIGYGMVRSMGSIIIQACKYRLLSKNCTFMIHDGYTAVEGSPKDVEAWAESSKKDRALMYKIYYERMRKLNSKITIKTIEEMCQNDCIMTGHEAVKLGLADKVL